MAEPRVASREVTEAAVVAAGRLVGRQAGRAQAGRGCNRRQKPDQ